MHRFPSSAQRAVVGSIVLLSMMGISMAAILSGPLVVPMARIPAQVQQCDAADELAIQALTPLMRRGDQRSTIEALSAFQTIAWAREDCDRGRWDRGMERYAQIQRRLVPAMP